MSNTQQSNHADNASTTYYTLNCTGTTRGNIGKMELAFTANNVPYMNVLLFVVANGNSKEEQKPSKMVNVQFPAEAADELQEDYGVGDYIRVTYDRIDLVERVKPMKNEKTGKSYLKRSSSTIFKATDIECLRKAVDKKDAAPVVEEVIEAPTQKTWRKKAA